MLLLYYNPSNKNYYLRYYKFQHSGYRVGYTNQFGHIVVKILIIQGGGLIDVQDVDAYHLQSYLNRPREQSLKKRLIGRLIDLLNKL